MLFFELPLKLNALFNLDIIPLAIPEALAKIPVLDQMRKEKGYSFTIQIDGGVGLGNLKEVMETGVDIVVAGSAVFGAADPAQATKDFLSVMEAYAS